MDGVLNSFEKLTNPKLAHSEWNPKTMKEYGIQLEVFPEQIANINRITDATGAKIVLSSSWRIGYLADWADVVIYLHNMGLKGFILGRTPWGSHLTRRGLEIQEWFKEHPNEKIDSFIILDDSGDMAPYLDHLIQTDYRKGLLKKHVKQAIKILGKK